MFQSFNYHNYTPELYDLVKIGFQIFDDRWTTYIPEYKRTLEQKIVDNYLFNQICCEEPERFRHYINTQLETIMPYYNKLYASELIKFNPILNQCISTEKRSVENLIKEANTANSNVGKQVRDFIASAENRTSGEGTSRTNTVGDANGNVVTNYNKKGDDKIDETVNQVGQSHTTTKETGTQKEDGTTTGTVTDNGNEHTINGGQDVVTKDLQKVTDGTENKKETGTVDTVTSGTENTTKSENGTENTQTDGTNSKDTTIHEETSTNGTKRYADTPQIDTKGNILNTYLTNYTATTDNTTKDGTENQEGKYSETKERTNKNDGTGTKENSGTQKDTIDKYYDTEYNSTVSETGDTTTKFGGTKDVESSNTRTTNMQENNLITKNLQTDTDANGTVNTTTDSTKNWKEDGDETKTSTEHTTGQTDGNTTSKGTEYHSAQEATSNSTSNAGSSQEKTAQTTDTGDNIQMSGFTNISASQLLLAFRETFINIDQMIIDELSENFMRVY